MDRTGAIKDRGVNVWTHKKLSNERESNDLAKKATSTVGTLCLTRDHGGGTAQLQGDNG